jgi:hypothetical protein
MALDDFGDSPLIVRSSSLLEDRLGATFSGKYRSLFLPNRGDKKGRLDARLNAIAEVYASTFGPDPIQYRAERGLIDSNEQMALRVNINCDEIIRYSPKKMDVTNPETQRFETRSCLSRNKSDYFRVQRWEDAPSPRCADRF